MSEKCSNCEGRIVLSRGGVIFLLVIVAGFAFSFGVIRTDDKWEAKTDQIYANYVDKENFFNTRDSLKAQLEACEQNLRTAARIGYDDNGVPLEALWDSYWVEWKRYED